MSVCLALSLCLVCGNKPWLACQIQLVITLINFNNGPICFMLFWFGYWLFIHIKKHKSCSSPRATTKVSSKEILQYTWMMDYDLTRAEPCQGEKKNNNKKKRSTFSFKSGKDEVEQSRYHWFCHLAPFGSAQCQLSVHLFKNSHMQKHNHCGFIWRASLPCHWKDTH